MRYRKNGMRQGGNTERFSKSHRMMKMFEGVWKESLDREKERRFPSRPWKNHQVQSILVIHQGALGDFILALPALETLRKAFPHAKSVIMGYPRILDLVERRFYV